MNTDNKVLNKLLEQFSKQGETDYLNLLDDIINVGVEKQDRTGVGTKSISSENLTFNLSYGFPLLTTKRVYWKGVVEELLWFIRGETNSKILEEKGVNIWKGNTTREFIDLRGLDYPEGEIGPGYGFQWRNWGGDYQKWLATGERTGIDQLSNLIQDIQNNPFSRRHILSAWNVSQLNDMVLPPCHMFCQFIVRPSDISENKNWLDCILYQRSCDFFLGVPFNIASYSLLLTLIAHYTDSQPGLFFWNGGDVHLYSNHVDAANEQLQRFDDIRVPPKLSLINMPSNIEDVTIDNLVLEGYNPHPPIKAEMAV